MGGAGLFPEIPFISGFHELSDEYAEVKCIRAAVGLSDPDHPCASAQPDPQDGDPKEDSASDLCTELYLGHRTLWYGPYVPFSGWTDQFTVRD